MRDSAISLRTRSTLAKLLLAGLCTAAPSAAGLIACTAGSTASKDVASFQDSLGGDTGAPAPDGLVLGGDGGGDGSGDAPSDLNSTADSPATDLNSADAQPGDGPPNDALSADTQAADTSTGPVLTAGVCFSELPTPATFTGTVPMPTATCPELAVPEWYVDQTVPPPSLTVLLGRRDAAGQWTGLQQGDWVALETAMQGGFHLELVPKILLPGKTEPKVQLQAEAFAAADCNPVASLNLAKAWLVRLPGSEPWYIFDTAAKPLVIFGVSVAKKAQFCGLWLQVHWRLRMPGTAQWGQAIHLLRTYDGTKLP